MPTEPTATDSTPAARFVWDGERARVVDANAQAVELFGEASVLDLVERPFAPASPLARALARLADAAKTHSESGGIVDGHMPHPVNGDRLRVTVTALPLADGRTGTSVTIRGSAGADGMSAQVAMLGEAIAAPGALFGADGQWLAGNDAAVALLGEVAPRLGELLGDAKAAVRLTGQALADGLASATFRISTRFGARLARVTLTRARDPKTGGAAVAAYFNDIADRARVLAAPVPEAVLDASAAATSAAATDGNAAREEAKALMSRVGHELRTPLNAILGFSQIMASERFGPIGNPKYAEYARDIQAGGEHLLGLVDDLLEMARSDNGRRSLKFEAVDVAGLIGQISDLLRDEAAGRGLTLAADIDGNVPPVVADARSLKQILINLIGNAIKFTPAGGTVTLAARSSEDGGVTLGISDTGIGMDADDLEAALEPFGQIEAAQTGLQNAGAGRGLGRGLGLGLPLSRTLAEANKAAFEIESAPGEGTRVTLGFPPTSVLAT